jgi:hypothetical protein
VAQAAKRLKAPAAASRRVISIFGIATSSVVFNLYYSKAYYPTFAR